GRCWNWAHNEMIPGSASPNQEQHWWDKYGPPLEHTMVVVAGSENYFLSYHYAKGTPHSMWASLRDGFADAAGVHYASRARMTSWHLRVDVGDGNDENGIGKWVDASVEYVCRPDDLLVIWRFRPSADIVVNNLYVAMWTAYAQDEDSTA